MRTDEFARRFAAKAASMATGDPREGTTPLGAVVDQKTVNHVNALIADAAAKGASVIAGGPACRLPPTPPHARAPDDRPAAGRATSATTTA